MEYCIRSWEKLSGVIGMLGMILPLLDCWKCGWKFPPSISESYYLGAIIPFTLVLGSIGIIFFCNDGFDNRDKWANRISGLAAIGVISFPCDSTNHLFNIPFPIIHYMSAVLLFLTFSYMCIFVFTQVRSDKGYTSNKYNRNFIYIGCGSLILISLILAKLVNIYWSEVIMLEAFGVAYMVQGKLFTALRD